MKKLKLVIVLTLIVSFTVSGQIEKVNSQNCVDKISIEPSFIAFTTKKDSNLGEWYKNTFGLKIVKEFDFEAAGRWRQR